MDFVRTADMRYVGQMHEITVPVPSGALTPDTRAAMEAYFHKTYEALYGSFTADDPIEALNWRLLATGPEPRVTLHVNGAGGGDAKKGTRQAYFPGKGFVETTVYDRYALPIGFRAEGPAIVEERESTAIVYPGDRFHIDKYKNLIVELAEAGA
jgi:5-oxoprolinase (ATP-hydrolysing)/N-methylhydantoinase A